MVKSFIDLLIASGSGHIVQIGSIAGVVPLAFGSTYNASKAALHAYGNTLRVELAPFGFVVNSSYRVYNSLFHNFSASKLQQFAYI